MVENPVDTMAKFDEELDLPMAKEEKKLHAAFEIQSILDKYGLKITADVVDGKAEMYLD